MEYEATVVLEKDYLHKPRRTTADSKEERTPLGHNDVLRESEHPVPGAADRKDADLPRQSSLDKPGWFNKA